jgi:transposase
MKIRFVGLDVHSTSITLAIADEDGSNPEVFGKMPNDTARLVKKLRELGRGRTLRCCYEAGPTGFGLHRDLKAAGIDCMVVAPSQVPDGRGARIKTDGRDSIRLARFLRSGDLKPIHVPEGETEAMRDLSRAREDALKAKQTARQQLGGFLLRHGLRYSGKKQGTKAHLTWVKQLTFKHEAQTRVVADYIATYEAACDREAKLLRDIEELVKSWALEPVVRALMALRSVQLITAVTVVAEVGDFARFAKATYFASYLGLTPSEQSSGERRMQGGITRHGNSHVRRVLVEAAWNYRHRPVLTAAIRKRGESTTVEVRAIAQKAQDRLYRRTKHLTARGKEKNKIATAVGRELGCFMWAIANHSSVKSEVDRRIKKAVAA